MYAVAKSPISGFPSLSPNSGYPYECVDDPEDIVPLFLNGKSIDICEWARIAPERRCDEDCPCVDPVPIKNYCRKTCNNCPSVPSPAPSQVPTATPTDKPSLDPTPSPSKVPTATPTDKPSSEPTSSCVDKKTDKKIWTVDNGFMTFCDWAAEDTKERCSVTCPCGEEEGLLVSDICPNTCDKCGPTASPSASPTLSPSGSPTICKDQTDCFLAGDGDDIVHLCDYVNNTPTERKKIKRCEEDYGFLGEKVKDYCRKTCKLCPDPPDPQTDPPTTLPPTDIPSNEPTAFPTYSPTNYPTASPTDSPSYDPSASPSSSPSYEPSSAPSACVDDEKCFAVPDGHTIEKLCDFAKSHLKKQSVCEDAIGLYVPPQNMPKGNPEYVKDVCRHTCGVCTSIGGPDGERLSHSGEDDGAPDEGGAPNDDGSFPLSHSEDTSPPNDDGSFSQD